MIHFGGQTCVGLPEKFRHVLRPDVSQGAQSHVLTQVKRMTMPRFQIPTIAVVGFVWTVQVGYCDNTMT